MSGEAGPDFQKAAAHRGVAFGDLDNDGRIDAVVTVLNGKVKYFHNVTRNGNHWILLKLIGKKSNRMGLGAQIRITTEDGKNAVQRGDHRCRATPAPATRACILGWAPQKQFVRLT